MGGIASANELGASIFSQAALSNTGKTVKASSATIYGAKIDCSANTGEKVYVKFYNSASPTVGTTAARMVLSCPAGSTRNYMFPRSLGSFDTAVVVAAVREAGGGAGATAPSGTVAVKVLYT